MIEIQVPEMHCQGCAARVKAALLHLDPKAQVMIDLSAKRASIQSDKARQDLLDQLHAEGFPEAA